MRGGGCGDGRGMAALGALVKKAWSVRRFVVLLCAPLALVPVLLSLPPKVPRTGARVGAAGWEHPLRGTDQEHKPGTLARDADRVYGAALHPGKWGSALGTRSGCSVPPLASAPAVFGSREGRPARV